MPLYVFKNEATGHTVEIPFPVNERPDNVIFKRVSQQIYENTDLGYTVTVPGRGWPNELVFARRTIPERIGTICGAKPPTMGEKLSEGYKRLEDKGQLKDAPGYLPLSAVKKALAEP